MQTTPPRPGRRWLAAVACVIACVAAVLGGAAPVSAHAALTGSDPAQGAVVDTAPTEVSLTFSEEVAMSDGSVRVLDPKGKRADAGKVTDAGSDTYRLKLRSGLPDGTFTVTYQVISADSHPVSGAFTFSVGAPSKTTVTVSGDAAGGGPVGALYGFARYVSYAGFILLVGGTAFVLACWPRGAAARPVQRVVVSGWVALTAATLALLLMRGSYAGSGKVGDIFDLRLLADVLPTKTGAALVSRLLLLAVAALFIAVLFGAYAKRGTEAEAEAEAEAGAEEAAVPSADGTGSRAGDQATDQVADQTADQTADQGAGEAASSQRDLAFGLGIGGAVVAVGLAATWAMAEHASVGIQAGLAMPVDVVHLLSVATWLGGLATLLTALYRVPSIEASSVRRFSRIAFCSVVVLASTGLYQSWRQVGSWSALGGTRYGQLLLVKVGLVAVVVAIAYFSRRWTARLADTRLSASAGTAVESDADAADSAADTVGRTGLGTGTGVGSDGSARGGEVALAETGEKSAGAGESDGNPPHNPARARQLARQAVAVAGARRKRDRDADPARGGLRRSVLAEAGVAVVLLAVTTVLTTTEPGRTEEQAAGTSGGSASAQEAGPVSLQVPFDTGGKNGKGQVLLDLTPSRTGSNEMHVYVEHPNGTAYDVPEVRVSFTLKAKSLGPLPVKPDHLATGHWGASGVQIPVAGNWQIAMTVRTSDIDEVTVTKNAQIG